MAVLYIILWHNAFILYTLFVEEIHGVGFLKKSISDILFIFQNLMQGFRSPFFLACTSQNTILL